MSKYNENLKLEGRNSLSLLLNRIKSKSTILEFGPAHGRMTKYLKEELDCIVYAVEIDRVAANDASQFTEKILVDGIETYSWIDVFAGIKFDYIIFADVLEHLYFPQKVLAAASEFLNESGKILVSIPNIAHNSVIIDLLADKFVYKPTGLLDDTHIRFFTKTTFDQLIRDCGLFRSYETGIYVRPIDTEFHNSYDELSIEIQTTLKKSFGGEIYQYIYEIAKKETVCFSDFNETYRLDSYSVAQLALDVGTGFSEGRKIKVPVEAGSHLITLEFDLSQIDDIKAIRFEPLNDFCVLDLKSIFICGQDVDSSILDISESTACLHHSSFYFFDSKTGHFLFPNLDSDILSSAKKVVVKLVYVHRSSEALELIVKQLLLDKMQTENALIDKALLLQKELQEVNHELTLAKRKQSNKLFSKLKFWNK